MEEMLSSKVKYGLGKLISYYRNLNFKESGDGFYKQEMFIKADADYPFEEIVDGENVCSIATFRRLEAGEPVKNDELYEYFIDKLDFEFDYRFELLDYQEKLGKRLYHAMEMYDCKEMSDIKKEVITFYSGAENDFYFSEFYKVYLMILNYNLDYVHPSKEECYEWLKKIEIFDGETQEMALIILLLKLYSREFQVETGIEICGLLENINHDSHMKVPYISRIAMRNVNRLFILEELNKAISYYDTIGSYYYGGFCRYARLAVLQYIDLKAIPAEIPVIESYFMKCSGILVDRKLINLYHFAGFFYNNTGDSKNALVYFRKYLDIAKGVDAPNVFHIMDCFLDCGVENWKEIFKEHPVNKNNDLTVFQEYYNLRINSEDYYEIQDYIVDKIIPALQVYKGSHYLIMFFSKEMMRFSAVTKRYKGFSTLIDLISENSRK